MKKRLQYGITAAIALLIMGLVLSAEGFFVVLGTGNAGQLWSMLCDAAFVPGALLTLIGIMIWISQTGFFDAIGYGVRAALHMIIPKRLGKIETLYDYKVAREESRGKANYVILWVGLMFLAAAFIFLAIYLKTEGI